MIKPHSPNAALAINPSNTILDSFNAFFNKLHGPTRSNSLPHSTPMNHPLLSCSIVKFPTMAAGVLVILILQLSFDASLPLPSESKNNIPPDVIAPGQGGIVNRVAVLRQDPYSRSFHSRLDTGIKPGPSGNNVAFSTIRPAGSTVSWAKSFLDPRFQSMALFCHFGKAQAHTSCHHGNPYTHLYHIHSCFNIAFRFNQVLNKPLISILRHIDGWSMAKIKEIVE